MDEYEYITREYKGEKVYARELRKMSRQGWEVVHAETIPIRRGCITTTLWVLLSLVTLGIWPLLVWLLRGRQVKVVVQYRRRKGAAGKSSHQAQPQEVVTAALPQKKKGNNKILWAIGGGVLLAFLSICVALAGGGKHTAPNGTSTVAVSATRVSTLPTPTVTPTWKPKPTLTPTVSMLKWGVISGIAPADVTVNLKQRGFSCGSVEESAGGGYLRSCKLVMGNADFQVDIYGDKILEVGMIEVNVTSTNGNPLSLATISPVMEFVSTIPFIDHPDLQNKAKQWVRTHLRSLNVSKSPQDGKIGQVYVEIVGNPPLAYSLSLSANK